MSEQRQRCILHVDMDAFYASVEQRDNPELRGKPLAVGGTSNRGVVAAASYESRKFGVRSAMPIREARRRCPELLTVRPRMAVYKDVSKQVFRVFRDYSPIVEGLSLDEAFIDVSGSLRLFGDGERIARKIKADIVDQTGLTASVGVAPNKLVAKIASDLDKPNGLVVITEDNAAERLAGLPASVIPGLGRETLARLAPSGIETLADLREADDSVLRPVFGRYTDRMRARAFGLDDRPVQVERREKSISAEQTFDKDLSTAAEMDKALLALSERTAQRLRKASLKPDTVVVKIREDDFTTVTRQAAMRPPSNATDDLYAAGRALVAQWRSEHAGARVRLLGIGGTGLKKDAQQDLFETPETRSEVDDALDEIREKFGDLSVGRARNLD